MARAAAADKRAEATFHDARARLWRQGGDAAACEPAGLLQPALPRAGRDVVQIPNLFSRGSNAHDGEAGRGAGADSCSVAPGMACDNQVAAFGQRAGTRSWGMPSASASSGFEPVSGFQMSEVARPSMMRTVASGIASPMRVAKAAGATASSSPWMIVAGAAISSRRCRTSKGQGGPGLASVTFQAAARDHHGHPRPGDRDPRGANGAASGNRAGKGC